MTDFMPTRLESNESLRNTWRSFLKHFDSRWDSNTFPEDDYPIFYSDCLSGIDIQKMEHAKASIIFSFDMFSGGRGHGSGQDHEFRVTLVIKREENLYDSIALDLVDAVLDTFEDDYIPLYNFYTTDGEEIRETAIPTGDDFPLYPAFSRVELDEAFAEYETLKVLHIYFEVYADRSGRTIDLRG